MNAKTTLLNLILFFVVVTSSALSESIHASQSCSQLLSGSGNFEFPGAPISLKAKLSSSKIDIFKEDILVSTVQRNDQQAFAKSIIKELGDSGSINSTELLRFEFSGDINKDDIAILMNNLHTETIKNELGHVEGSFLKKGRDKKKKSSLIGKGSKRYNFTKASIRSETSSPVSLGPSGKKFYQNFLVDVPSTPSPLDFVVRMLFNSRGAVLEVIEKPEDVIRSALHQEILEDATLRQATNEILGLVRATHPEWNASVEGSDYILVIRFLYQTKIY